MVAHHRGLALRQPTDAGADCLQAFWLQSSVKSLCAEDLSRKRVGGEPRLNPRKLGSIGNVSPAAEERDQFIEDLQVACAFCIADDVQRQIAAAPAEQR